MEKTPCKVFINSPVVIENYKPAEEDKKEKRQKGKRYKTHPLKSHCLIVMMMMKCHNSLKIFFIHL